MRTFGQPGKFVGMETLIDTHAHLDDQAFGADLEAVIRRAQAAGVARIITVGTDVPSSRTAVSLAERYTIVYAAVGIHPHEAKTFSERALKDLRALAAHPKVVAIGETGLDFYRNLSPKEAQLRAFRAHWQLAQELGLPVIVHDREAHAETIRELTEATRGNKLVGVLHCFSGDPAMAQAAVDLGFYISIAGPITYNKAGNLSAVVRALPIERLLLETDCPYLAPVPCRGRRNEPAYITYVAQGIAQVRDLPATQIAAVTRENALRLFGRIHR